MDLSGNLRELTKVFYKLLEGKNVTKFSDEFVQKVQNFYKEGKKQKKASNDKVFTIEDVVEKFGILPNQVKRILYIESKVKHDVIAFLTSITEKAGKEAKYLHKGMTSSDVLDPCFNLQLKQSGKILLKDIMRLIISISMETKDIFTNTYQKNIQELK